VNIAIIGLGLMGGSLGAALKRGDRVDRVLGYARRGETRDAALAQGIVDEAFESPTACVREADLVVLCLPVLAMEPCLVECRGALKGGALVTDVGSTKRDLHDALTIALDGADALYIGSHPMAGSEESGLQAADPELYRDSAVIITPEQGADDARVIQLWEFWVSLGAIVQATSPAEHDRIVAATSHFPHLLASVLVRHVLSREHDVEPYCGSGFRDSTRIAEGPSDVWHDVFNSNRENLLAELKAFEEQLASVREILESEDFEVLRVFLEHSRELREKVG
jgi:prephenate dehydrogenase